MSPKPGNTNARGYGARHQRERAKWKRIVDQGDAHCWRCGTWLEPGKPFDLGHDDNDRSIYRGPECVPCNRKAGGRQRHAPKFPPRRDVL